ncbi:MAG: hypothetical protein NTX59_02005 [Elusimicrobia bacterium]|nr:hypothetical protein [Elusimicrobiota bacterium]
MGVEKAELIKMLEEAFFLEEQAMPIYSRHLKTALFWRGLNAATREQLRIQLGILEKESNRHAKVLGEMKKKIEEDKRNVF